MAQDDLLRSRGKKPRKGAVLKCEECGTAFYAAPSEIERRRYCSTSCRQTADKRNARTACVVCGGAFNHSASIGGKYCSRACYEASRRPGKPCKVCGKPLPLSSLTYCSKACMTAGRKTGSVHVCEQCGGEMYLEPKQVGKKRFCSRACANEALKLTGPGTRVRRTDGYFAVYFPKHPDASKTGWVMEHRLVAEQKYGRRILPTEHVHHINHDPGDNRPENLEIQHPSIHARISTARGKAKRAALAAKLAEYERLYGPLPEE